MHPDRFLDFFDFSWGPHCQYSLDCFRIGFNVMVVDNEAQEHSRQTSNGYLVGIRFMLYITEYQNIPRDARPSIMLSSF